jgi:hypothetical protein
MGILESLGGKGHLDEVEAGLRQSPVWSSIKARYPTTQKLRARLVIVMGQSGYTQRVGDQGSGTYEISPGYHPWRK